MIATDAGPACPICGSTMALRRARRGVHAGQPFWGCSRYPHCRGIVNIAEPLQPPSPIARRHSLHAARTRLDELPPIGSGAVIGTPGGSALRQYGRRRARDSDDFPRRLELAVLKGTVGGGIIFIVVAQRSVSLAILCAGIIVGAAIVQLALPKNTTTAWATGAAGEERTAGYLDPLADEGFVVLHDRKIPHSPANIDHLVIGPTGVYVVETKSIAGKLQIDGAEVRIGGRRVRVVDEVLREAAAVDGVLASWPDPDGHRVVPVICVHRADLPWFRRDVHGIRIVTGRGLVRLLHEAPVILSPDEVHELARLAVLGLRGKP